MNLEILSNGQMALADRLTIEAGTPGYDLMCAAGAAVAGRVMADYPDDGAVLVLCGPGNNGGDGYVAAKLLREAGRDVFLWSLVPPESLKGDARQAFEECPDLPRFSSLNDLAGIRAGVAVDAVFGTGFRGALPAAAAVLFGELGDGGCPVLAVDIPSGVNGDTGAADPRAPQAAGTVTFFRKKAGHVLMPGLALCGRVSVHDIGIREDVLAQTGWTAFENAPPLWRDRLPRPQPGGHKYGRGHLVVRGGARMTGAARMASEAAMRAGAGLCTVVAEESAAVVYKRDGAPHVMFEPLGASFAEHIIKDERRTAALTGPGAGLEDREGLRRETLALLEAGRPAVLDADALSCFEGHENELHRALHGRCALTPHDGEFARIFPGLDEGSRLDRARRAADLCPAVILLKGPDTVIAQAGRIPAVNIHATPWLATAGAGDVLAGIIGGLLAQGMEAFDAACAGAWIHGEAALLHGGPGLVAPDIIEGIPQVLSTLSG